MYIKHAVEIVVINCCILEIKIRILDMDTVEKCWGQSSRNEVRRLQKDENGLSGMANYIVKEKKRIRSEKRNSPAG